MRPAAHGGSGVPGCSSEVAAIGVVPLLRLAVAPSVHVVEVLEQLGEPVLGRLVLLQALGEGLVLQLVGKALAERLASPVRFFKQKLVVYYYMQSLLNEFTFGCRTVSGNSVRHASANVLKILWPTQSPFCPIQCEWIILAGSCFK